MATNRYADALEFDPEALAVLEARGLTVETIRTYRLGVVTDPSPGHGHVEGFLAIPYLDKDGEPLAIRFRCLEDHNHRDFYHGKYMGVEDEETRVYNVMGIHAAGQEIHITEGELDALILNQCGFPAVAIPGAHGWKPYYRRMLAGFSPVYVWPDPDDAGAKFAATIERAMYAARRVRLTAGDVNETYLEGGIDALLKAKAEADSD